MTIKKNACSYWDPCREYVATWQPNYGAQMAWQPNYGAQ